MSIESSDTIENPLNKEVLNALGNLDTILKERGTSPMAMRAEEISLVSGGQELATITSADVLVLGKSFQEVLVGGEGGEPFQSEKLKSFLGVLSENLIGLNHLGISYFVEDIDREAETLTGLARNRGVNLYSESASSEDEKWLFAGDAERPQEPLFEFVLNKGPKVRDLWRPHFQIDIDTKLSRDEIKRLTEEYFGEGFIKWELDTPDYGVVLVMGILGDISGTKIVLGIGTNLRNTERHRLHELRKIS